MFVYIAYLLCVPVLIVHLYCRFCRAGRLVALIPGPVERPVIGNMLDMREDSVQLFKKLREWTTRYGKIYKLQGFWYRTVHISEPDDIETLLSSSRLITKDMPYSFLHNWLREGLLISNGKKWQQRRKLLTPAFHFNILTKFFKAFCEQSQQLLNTIENEIDQNDNNIDVIPLINKLSLRIMCETSMGTKISDSTTITGKYLKNVHSIGACYASRLSRPWFFITILYKLSPLSKIENSYLPDLHNFTKQLIRDRREVINKRTNTYSKENKPVMLDLLLEEEKKGNINENGICEEVDTFLFEGFDTTATAIIFMIMRIANEPDIQNTIYEELQSIYGNSDREPTIQDLSQMKYLDCCVKESLRLYASVPFISRYITEDTILAGYKIPKGSYCDVHIYDVHRNPKIYPDPEKFIPERFLPETAAKRHPFAYIPFSAGPRNCIGQKFGLMEMKTVMSCLLRKYRLKPVTRTEDLVFVADMILRVNHPIYVRFCRRKQ